MSALTGQSIPVRSAAARDDVTRRGRCSKTSIATASSYRAFPPKSLCEFRAEVHPVPSPRGRGTRVRGGALSRGHLGATLAVRTPSPPPSPHGRGGCSCPWQHLRFGRGDRRRQFAEVSHGRGSYCGPSGRFGFSGSGRFALPQRPATALHRIAGHVPPWWRRGHGGRGIFASPGIDTVEVCCSKYLSRAERHRGEGMCPSMTPQSLTPTHPHDRSARAPRPECRPAPRERAPASLIASSEADHV